LGKVASPLPPSKLPSLTPKGRAGQLGGRVRGRQLSPTQAPTPPLPRRGGQATWRGGRQLSPKATWRGVRGN